MLPLGNSALVASLCDLEAHGDGLVGGTFKDTFWLSSGLKDAENIAAEREAGLRLSKPPTCAELFKVARVALVTSILSTIACIITLPSLLKRKPKRRIRRLMELENEWGRVLSAIDYRREERVRRGV